MDARTFVAFMVNALGKVRGKKAYQKYVYLAKAYGIPLNYAYTMHYYGPYSEKFATELENAYRDDVVDLVEGSTFIYRTGSKTQVVLDRERDEIKKHQKELTTLIETFGNMTPLELEIYATAHFVWRIQTIFGEPTDRETVIEEIKKAKHPKFDMEQIIKSYDDLVSWGLIKVS
ncbi:MAG: hypothetical protein VR68_04300 [Peptococcaceae bacterium BRH_c4a]|nr:MAG: hypothetical protein VR68_04300 [Peptococcaceae bacterium BRH_c4a]